MFIGGISGVMASIAIGAIITNIGLTTYNGIRHGQGAGAIVWDVIQNLATFGAIIGALLLSGPIALIAALTLVLTSIIGIINLVRSWSYMDTTDKVIAAATFLTFIVFAGAIKGGTISPEPTPQISGEVCVLPDSYFSRVVIDMRNAPAGSDINAAGFPRNGRWFFRQLRESNAEFFSESNIKAINEGRAPIVDAKWVEHHPQHVSFIGDKLIHHHIEQGPHAVALPETIHVSWNNLLHKNTK